jgi:hypothetical protein
MEDEFIVINKTHLMRRISEYLSKMQSDIIEPRWKDKYEAKMVELHKIISESIPLDKK